MWKLAVLVVVMFCPAEAYRNGFAIRRAQVSGRCRAAMDEVDDQREPEAARPQGPKLNFFQKVMQGLDDLVDDALDRKLGNGGRCYSRGFARAHASGTRRASRVPIRPHTRCSPLAFTHRALSQLLRQAQVQLLRAGR
jgi:hypothetical protein